MATVTYRLKGTSKLAGVKIRFKQGDLFDFELSTGIRIPRDQWMPKAQRVKSSIEASAYCDVINKKLNILRSYILNSYYATTATNTPITQKWLKQKVNEKLERVFVKNDDSLIFFIPYVKSFIDNSKKSGFNPIGKKITERTIQHYESTLNKLIDYDRFTGQTLKIVDINLRFHKSFLSFLSDQQKLNPNTIGTYISKIKFFCNSAEAQGLNVHKDIKSRGFYVPHNESEEIYLNTKEIEKIFNHTFESERLENARNWLIIGVWTGLRVSDLLSLSRNNIEDNLIQIETNKTKTPIAIPIHPQVKQILLKNKGLFPRKVSDQNYNRYIKEIGREVGLTTIVNGTKMMPIKINGKKVYRKEFGHYKKWELLASHIGRRSFATNLYGEMDTPTIMNITGHSTEKMLLGYIRKPQIHHAKKLDDFWNS